MFYYRSTIGLGFVYSMDLMLGPNLMLLRVKETHRSSYVGARSHSLGILWQSKSSLPTDYGGVDRRWVGAFTTSNFRDWQCQEARRSSCHFGKFDFSSVPQAWLYSLFNTTLPLTSCFYPKLVSFFNTDDYFGGYVL